MTQDFKLGYRVVAVRNLLNGPNGPKDGDHGIVCHVGDQFCTVDFYAWETDRSNKTWSTNKEDIKIAFKLWDRVCLPDSPSTTGVLTKIEEGDSLPYCVTWDEKSDREKLDNWYRENGILPVTINNKPSVYTLLKVGASVIVNDDGGEISGTIVQVDEDDDDVYLVEVESEDQNWYQIHEVALGGSAKPGENIKPDRLAIGTLVHLVENLYDFTTEDLFRVIEDDKSSLPYKIEVVEGERFGRCHLVKRLQVRLHEEKKAAVEEVDEPDSQSFAIEVVMPRNELKPDVHVRADRELDCDVKKGMVGTIIVGPDQDGDVEIMWLGYDQGHRGTGKRGEACKAITFATPREQTCLSIISNTDFRIRLDRFYVGDRVIAVAKIVSGDASDATGYIGTVAEANGGPNCTVKFDGMTFGHDGMKEAGSRQYLHCCNREVHLLNDPRDHSDDFNLRQKDQGPFTPGGRVIAVRDYDGKIRIGMTGRLSSGKARLSGDSITVYWDALRSGHGGGGEYDSERLRNCWNVPEYVIRPVEDTKQGPEEMDDSYSVAL